MQYLIRPKAPPRPENLTEAEQTYLRDHFDAHPAELTVDGQAIPWQFIDEIEVVKAARQKNLSGWFVRKVLYAEERFHVGIYVGQEEAVLPNITLATAKFVVQSIAHYMQTPIRYSGLEGIAAVRSED